MVPKNFEVNDLVWAKMKGYPYWPGKIMMPPADAKPKKNHHFVYFFGSKNFAWIADEFIELHDQKMLDKYGDRKGGESFRKAVESIMEQSTSTGKMDNTSKAEESEEKFDEVANSVSQFKNKSPLGSLQKLKKKLSMKKIPVSIASGEKSSRKRPHSPESSSNFIPDDMDVPEQNLVRQGTCGVYRAEKPGERKISRSILEREKVPLPPIPPVDLKYNSHARKGKKIQPTDKKIGFLGLSHLAQAVLKNLCTAGHCITIWDETPKECEKVANWLEIEIADTPAKLIESVDIAICLASDPETAKNIIKGRNGILEGLEHSRGSKSFVEMTLIEPKMSLMFATEITSKGGRYLEAPFNGSLLEAVEGNLLIVAAGDQTVYDDCKSCFDAISQKYMFISAEIGNASKLNIVHNMLIGTVLASIGEALSLIEECNLTSPHYAYISKTGPVTSSALHRMLVAMIYKDYTPYLTLREIQKSFCMGLLFGDGISQHSSLFANANELFKRCIFMNYGDHDISAVYEGTH